MERSKFAWWLSIFLFLAIILNCMAFIVGSVKSTQYVVVLSLS